ncbi:MAG: sigma-70 family RNA polymerase sigma factor [Rhizobium sp.]|nr:MAG: sigma-70 family RNA polymerase sigma factor [Rhizobium sp.]
MNWDLNGLFRRHAKEVVRFLRRRGVNEETASDLTQDAFVRLLSYSGSPHGDGSNPRALLFHVARNLSIDLYRRERLAPRAELTDEEFLAIPDFSPSAETIVYDQQRLAITATALAELPERTRLAFELHRLGEMTIAEVAEQLGLSTTRTWALIRDAYHHIRLRLRAAE